MEELNNLTPEESAEDKKTKEDVETLHQLIRGQNDIYTKTYEFKELSEPLTVKVKYPTFLERGRINAIREEMLYGMGKYQTDFVYEVFNTVAILEVCGIDVPPYLSKDKEPRDDVLYMIGLDINNWIHSFR